MENNTIIETHMLWDINDTMKVHVINEIGYPIFSLEDISAVFGYSFDEVCYLFRNQMDGTRYDENQTFVVHPEGLYVSILVPILLAKTAPMDGYIDEAQSWERMGVLGRIVEETMPDGDKYMEVMTKWAIELLGEAFK